MSWCVFRGKLGELVCSSRKVSRAHVTQAVQITAQSSQSQAKDRMVGTLDEAPVD